MTLRVGTIWLLGTVFLASQAGAASQEHPDDRLRELLRSAIEAQDSFQDRFEAEVWLLDMSTRLEHTVEDPDERLDILRHVHREALRADLKPELVLAVVDVESRFERFAISRVGARGLMQIMPFWLDEIGHPRDNLFHIRTNLRMGCTILRYYLDMEKGNVTLALARYNGSLGSLRYPNLVFSALRKRWY